MKKISIKVISDVVCNNLFRNFDHINEHELDFIFTPVDQIIPNIISAGEEDFLLLHLSQYAFNSYGVSDTFASNIDEIIMQLKKLVDRSNTKLILNTVYFNCESFSQDELIEKRKMASNINSSLLEFVSLHKSQSILVDIEGLVSRGLQKQL